MNFGVMLGIDIKHAGRTSVCKDLLGKLLDVRALLSFAPQKLLLLCFIEQYGVDISSPS